MAGPHLPPGASVWNDEISRAAIGCIPGVAHVVAYWATYGGAGPTFAYVVQQVWKHHNDTEEVRRARLARTWRRGALRSSNADDPSEVENADVAEAVSAPTLPASSGSDEPQANNEEYSG